MANVKVNKKGSTKAPTKYKMLDVLSKEFQGEIAKHAQRLFDAANKRLKRIEQAKLVSPAYISAMKRGGKFSGKGFRKPENWNDLMREYGRVIQFLNSETSTLTGAKNYEKKMRELVGDVTPEKREIIFDAFAMVEELGLVSAKMYGSERLISNIANIIDNDVYNELMRYERGSAEYVDKLSRIIDDIKKDVDKFYGDTVYKDDVDIDYFIHLNFDE